MDGAYFRLSLVVKRREDTSQQSQGNEAHLRLQHRQQDTDSGGI